MAQNFSFVRGDWVRKGPRAKKPVVRVFPQLALSGDDAQDEEDGFYDQSAIL